MLHDPCHHTAPEFLSSQCSMTVSSQCSMALVITMLQNSCHHNDPYRVNTMLHGPCQHNAPEFSSQCSILGFSIYKAILSTNSDKWFTSSSTIWMSFIYFSCIIVLATISNTMLNKSGKSEHPYLLPDLRRKASSFSPLSVMLDVKSLVYYPSSCCMLLLST